MEHHVTSWCRWLPLVLLMMTLIDYTVDTIEGKSLSKNKDRSLWLYPETKPGTAVNIGHKIMEMSSAETSLRGPSGIGRVLLSLMGRQSKLDERRNLSPSATIPESDSLGGYEQKKSTSLEVEASTLAQKDSVGPINAEKGNKASNADLQAFASNVAHKDLPENSQEYPPKPKYETIPRKVQ